CQRREGVAQAVDGEWVPRLANELQRVARFSEGAVDGRIRPPRSELAVEEEVLWLLSPAPARHPCFKVPRLHSREHLDHPIRQVDVLVGAVRLGVLLAAPVFLPALMLEPEMRRGEGPGDVRLAMRQIDIRPLQCADLADA